MLRKLKTFTRGVTGLLMIIPVMTVFVQFCSVQKKEICITTPIFYVNSQPHIGHLYTLILSDAYYKWKKIDNFDAYLQTGTDEHGQKIQNAAKNAQIEPQDFVDNVSQTFVQLSQQYGISYDAFNRTSLPAHKEGVKHIWNVLEKNGFIETKKYEGWYHTSDETFIGEKDLVKDSTGKFVTQLGQPVDWVSEETHIFVLDKIRHQVQNYIETERPIFPDHYNTSILKQLEDIKVYKEVFQNISSNTFDISISRPKSRLSWGISVPTNENYTIYVWLDALANYLTGLGYPHDNKQKMYLAKNFCHIMGKDILKFHALFWPAFLLAAGYSTPQKMFIHHHWIKDHVFAAFYTRNVVDPVELGNRFGIDSIRLYFLAEGPQDYDANFDETVLIKNYNTFIEGFTNLLSRILNKKIIKDGKINNPNWLLNSADIEYITKFNAQSSKIYELFDKCDFRKGYVALSELWGMSNKLMTEHAPWQKDVTEENKAKLSYLILESARIMSILIYPFIPSYIEKVYKVMNLKGQLINTKYLKFRLVDKNTLPTESFDFESISQDFLRVDVDNKKLIFKTKVETSFLNV